MLPFSQLGTCPYYERFGFEVTGELVIAGGPTLWPMWRQPR
jgi:predicted N-acetyltransferase YhbS